MNGTLDNLPHVAPFRFVTSIESIDAGRAGVGLWLVSGVEDFFAGHFPGDPVLPGVLVTEALAQLSGLVAFAVDNPVRGRTARLAQVNIKFLAGVVPPAEVRLESTLTRELGELIQFDVRAQVAGKLVASGSLVLARTK